MFESFVSSPHITGWIALLLLPVSFVLLVSSALLERSGLIRLRHWAEEAGGKLRRLYETASRFEAFRFLLSVLARVTPILLLVCLWGFQQAMQLDAWWWLAPLLVAAYLTLGEWLLRWLLEVHCEKTLSRLTNVFRVLYFLTSPFVWTLHRLLPIDPVDEEEGEDQISEEEIDAFIDVGRREGILEPEEEEMVRSIVDFGDTHVRSVMTPRVEITSVSAEADVETLAATFLESKRARLPVYRDTIDQVVGILHLRDLFAAIHSGESRRAEELANAPFYVPENKPLRDLLEEMQALHQQMAIVVDEYGGVAGLVTVEDLLEEIVGEINDEHEATGIHHVRLDDESWQMPGRIHLEDLIDALDLDLDLDALPYETLSGWICGELGHVPKEGEKVQMNELTLLIEGADKRRVTSVVVRRVRISDAEQDGGLT